MFLLPSQVRYRIALAARAGKFMLTRNVTNKIAYVLDNIIPPVLRDSRWFMWIPFKLLFGDKAADFFEFKDRAFEMSFDEFRETYRSLESVHIQRDTDLNDACTSAILENVGDGTVLEVGCGRGYLAARLAERAPVTACDMAIPDTIRARYPHLDLREARIDALPFADREFDTVVCTHTLEHVLDIRKAIGELRRVARTRLIIVVPKQRPYRYTFDLHVHFFPYEWSLLAYMGSGAGAHRVKLLDGDWYYQEEL